MLALLLTLIALAVDPSLVSANVVTGVTVAIGPGVVRTLIGANGTAAFVPIIMRTGLVTGVTFAVSPSLVRTLIATNGAGAVGPSVSTLISAGVTFAVSPAAVSALVCAGVTYTLIPAVVGADVATQHTRSVCPYANVLTYGITYGTNTVFVFMGAGFFTLCADAVYPLMLALCGGIVTDVSAVGTCVAVEGVLAHLRADGTYAIFPAVSAGLMAYGTRAVLKVMLAFVAAIRADSIVTPAVSTVGSTSGAYAV